MNSNLGWLEEDSLRKRSQIQKEPGREEPDMSGTLDQAKLCDAPHQRSVLRHRVSLFREIGFILKGRPKSDPTNEKSFSEN